MVYWRFVMINVILYSMIMFHMVAIGGWLYVTLF